MMPAASGAIPAALPPTAPRHLAHIRELDGVRGLAALAVFVHHVCFTSIAPTGWHGPIEFLRVISIAGAYGVDLFFVLSGFLITSLLIEARSRPAYYQDFYWKRGLRILPLYLCCLLGVLLFLPGSGGYVLLSALFISNFASMFHVLSSGPFWTLAIEEQFYVVWPTVVRRRSVAEVRRWAIAVGGAAVVLRMGAAAFGHYNYLFTFFRCDGLAFGAFLACWMYRRDAAEFVAGRKKITLAALSLVGLAFITVSLPSAHNVRWIAFESSFQQTGITLLSGSIVGALVLANGHQSVRLLRAKGLTFFGLISYALYMTHLYVLRSYDYFRGPLVVGDTLAYGVRFISVLAVTVAVCLVSRHVVELPAISLRRYVLSRPAVPNAAEPPIPLGNM